MASNLRRAEDLQRVKTRELVFQYTDGTFPSRYSVPVVSSTTGDIGFSDAHINPAGALTLPCGINAAAGRFMVRCNSNTTIERSLSIGSNTVAAHTLDVSGQVSIRGGSSSTAVFDSPGTYTVVVPANVSTMTFEMIGAGGSNATGGGIGGTGGYIKGSVNVSAYQGSLLTVVVGAAGAGLYTSATASYITKLTTGPIFAMAGAGGNSTYLSFPAGNGGGGGGGAFDGTGVAVGEDGAPNLLSGAGQGGQSAGGGAGGVGNTFFGTSKPGNPGAGRPGVENYLEAAGGAGTNITSYQLVSGGNGYTGGGQSGGNSVYGSSAGGGGGSSYVNLPLTTVTTSHSGSTVPAGLLSGYGRADQGGYVSISFTGLPSLTTAGDVIIGGSLSVATDVSAGGTLMVGGDSIQIRTSQTPASAAAAGTTGQICWDSGYLYVCTATNTWKRVAVASWP